MLRRVLDQLSPSVVIHGAAPGADSLAARWAEAAGVQCEAFPVSKVEWSVIGPAAGPMRNQRMLDLGKPEMVLAFPGNRGTADMIRRAVSAGVPVKRVNLKGELV